MIDQEAIGLLLKGVNNVTWQSLTMMFFTPPLISLPTTKPP